jgi:16S rRNA (guanine527-N7)-methyltransferase
LIDVGSGAGFPGLVLKIAYPHLQVTLLDSLEKRLRFSERVGEALGLEGIRPVHARAEDAAAPPGRRSRRGSVQPPHLRERFDVVTARAVARLQVLVEWSLPFARVGGCFVAMKGPDVGEEVGEARKAIARLGGGEPQVRTFQLPGANVGRSLVRIDKVKPTPLDLPRPPGTARKTPL